MNQKYTFPTVTEALPFICSRLLDIGDEVGSRNGRVKELLNTQIVLTDPQHREVLSLNRKANVFAQIAETMWVLAGRNDIEWLSAYLPRAKDYSDDGKTWRGGYGPRIRMWGGWPHQNDEGLIGGDQLAHVVDVLREDPLSRRAVISIYDPKMDTNPGKDIPCNDFLQFQSRLGALHLTVTVRSNDVMWGWSGINAFEWSTLQEIVAHLIGNTVGTLTFNIGNLHLYAPHWDKASRLENDPFPHAITPFQMPDHMDRTLEWVDIMIDRWFSWEGMCRAGQATPELLEDFDEPLFRSWAIAIAWYWQREPRWLEMLHGTALAVAIGRVPASVLSEAPQTSRSGAAGAGTGAPTSEAVRAFYDFVKDLHAKKHASYGDSWKKRGEKMSILANMARKVDRLGVGDEYDSSADTLIDLLVYGIKYGCWLAGKMDGPDEVNLMLSWFLAETEETTGQAADIAIKDIVDDFNAYCDNVDNLPDEQKREYVTELCLRVAPIARDVWLTEAADNLKAALFGDECNHGSTRIFLEGRPGEHEKCLDCGALMTDKYRGADAD
jgi:thymidylate synthase